GTAQETASLHAQQAAAADAPLDRGRRRRRRQPSFVDAFEVAPEAEASQVLALVGAAVGAEGEVVRRWIAAVAHRAQAPEEVARVDVPVGHAGIAQGRAPRAPDLEEEELHEADTVDPAPLVELLHAFPEVPELFREQQAERS